MQTYDLLTFQMKLQPFHLEKCRFAANYHACHGLFGVILPFRCQQQWHNCLAFTSPDSNPNSLPEVAANVALGIFDV